MAANGMLAYRRAQVQTAHPAQLVVQLYEQGVIRFLRMALVALEVGDVAAAHNALVRAQDVVVELRATLNQDAGDMAVELGRLYDLLYRKLVLANVRKDVNLTREVLGHFAELLPAWQAAARESLASSATGLAGPTTSARLALTTVLER